jgi:hypothetical protein
MGMFMNCFAHKTNLVVITLLKLVCWLEGILQNQYNAFFAHNPKKFGEFQKLANLMNMKGNKLF